MNIRFFFLEMSLSDSLRSSAGFGSASATPVAIAYPLQNYNFGVKDPKPEKDTSVHARLLRMEKMYEEEGMRRSGTPSSWTLSPSFSE